MHLYFRKLQKILVNNWHIYNPILSYEQKRPRKVKSKKKKFKILENFRILKADRIVKISPKNCFLASCKKRPFWGICGNGENFTKFWNKVQIFFLKFMHKKRMNFASETQNNANRINH